jgi:hypothetical protein
MNVKDIKSKRSYLTERTISYVLSELLTENKVFKSKWNKKYYVRNLFVDNGWSIFAEFLKEFQRQYTLNKIPLGKIYSSRHTFHNEFENEIFNFGNIIGAFFTYILVESLRPNEKPTAENRYGILIKFLGNAVDMESIFLRFVSILPKDSTNRLLMGFDNKLLEKIINAYNNVYPGFSEVLDRSFEEYIRFDINKSCDHEWHEVFVHKIGKRFECRKCLGLVEEQDLEPSIT